MITATANDAAAPAAVCTILRSNKCQLTLRADWDFLPFLYTRKKIRIRIFIGVYNDDFI